MVKWLRRRRFDGKRVSFLWLVVLTAARKAGVQFRLDSGKRTIPEQRALFNQNMQLVNGRWVPKPDHPVTAWPSPTAPHIKRGNPAHAVDINSLDGGETRLEAWMERHGMDWRNTVSTEPWHAEVPLAQLIAFATLTLRRKEEARKKAIEARRRRRAAKRRARKTEIARNHGAHYTAIIYDACLELGIPYALGLAMCQQETGFENEYGHDALPGQAPIWHGSRGKVLVTAENVQKYLAWARQHKLRQGVGPMQLTSESYQLEAERRGGLHKPEVTIPYGLEILAGHIKALGTVKGIGAFNGGRGNPNLAYARNVVALWNLWRGRLN